MQKREVSFEACQLGQPEVTQRRLVLRVNVTLHSLHTLLSIANIIVHGRQTGVLRS